MVKSPHILKRHQVVAVSLFLLATSLFGTALAVCYVIQETSFGFSAYADVIGLIAYFCGPLPIIPVAVCCAGAVILVVGELRR